ncbi:MAG: serine hydrolase domain-containing protein [Gemmatimonadota bacterium]
MRTRWGSGVEGRRMWDRGEAGRGWCDGRIRWKAALVVATLISGVPGVVPASGRQVADLEVPRVVRGELGRRMDGFLTRASSFGFDGQVLVERDGELVLHEAYGIADRGSRRAMTTETRIGIASMSKQLVAAAVLALEERGRLSVTDPIGRHLAGLPEDKAPITIHQLLTHTAGLRGGDVVGDFAAESRDELLDRIVGQPLAAPPGERWRYANAGYNLLAAIVEAVTGAPYEAFLAEALFEPASMERTGFWHWPRLTESDVAHAYRGWRDTGSPAEWPRNWRIYGAGDIVSTVADLYRWERALRDGRILSAESVERYMAPHVALGSEGSASYAYGLFVDEGEDGRRVVEHGGDWQGGYNGVFLRYPDEGLVIIVLANARDGGGQWRRHSVQRSLERMARGAEPGASIPAARPLSPRDRLALRGEFELDGGGLIRFVDDGSYLWITGEGQRAVSLLRDGAPEPAPALERAGAKTRRLLAGLIANGRPSYERALTEDGLPYIEDYWSEWSELVERYGHLTGFELLGSVPIGRSVETTARLRFDAATIPMSFIWRDGAQGRLGGTLVRDEPVLAPTLVGYPIAAEATGGGDGIVGWDLFRESGVTFRLERCADEDGGGLRIVFDTADGPVRARRK